MKATGRKCSEETKRKISEALKGQKRTSEQRAKLSAARKGRKFGPFTEEHKRKLSEANKGKHNRPHTEEEKAQISASLTGRELSSEHIAKIRAGLTGRSRAPFSDEWRQHMGDATRAAYAEGRRSREVSEEWRQRVAETRRERGVARGEKNPNWKGGRTALGVRIRNSEEYNAWRARVFERDGFVCQACGVAGDGGNLQAHHETPLSVLLERHAIRTMAQALKCAAAWDIANGTTLCVGCHQETDSYGWRVWNGELRQGGGALA